MAPWAPGGTQRLVGQPLHPPLPEGTTFSSVSLNREQEEATLQETLPALRGCRVKAEKEWLEGWGGGERATFSTSQSSQYQGVLACRAVQGGGAQTPLTFSKAMFFFPGLSPEGTFERGP